MITNFTFLMYKATSSAQTFSKLCDIKAFPNMGSAPEALDATTLSDFMRTYEKGIQENEALTFTAKYTKTDYETLDAIRDDVLDYALWLGGTESGGVVTPTGSDGKFDFKATLDVHLVGKGVNELQEMEITLYPTTGIVMS